jgi:hypothetical protein
MSFHDDYSDSDTIVEDRPVNDTECAHCHQEGAWMSKAEPVREALYGEKVMKRYHEDCYYDAAACI